MKPLQLVLFWLLFFGTYLIFTLISYICIPEGALLNIAQQYSANLTSEGWDNFMGYVIFIGSALINAAFIWIVVWLYQRPKTVEGNTSENK